MNVTQLARQVRLSPKELRAALPLLGFDVGARAIKVDNKVAQAIIRKLGNRAARDRVLHELQAAEDLAKGEVASEPEPGASQSGEEILVPDEIVVKELAKQMKVNVTKLVVELMKQGVMASLNDRIDFETATIVAEDFGFKTKKDDDGARVAAGSEEKFQQLIESQTEATLKPRPPVVVVMGHVDHGKTKLLDAIRQTDVVSQEAGGITQHIGAYQVEEKGQKLTFIDTPGHEAFSLMRSRGAKVADMAILVVAADDGVQPQTIEAISHIRKAELPFIVAVNKIDKPEANQDKVKKELADLGLTPEDWGGNTIMVPISAKQQENIHGLLEALLLVYEVEKENITADAEGLMIGTIIESHIDKGSGPVATVLVRNGTLRQGDQVLVSNSLGKARLLKDWRGQNLSEAAPSTPVVILGLKQVPSVGDLIKGVEDIAEVKQARRVRKKHEAPAAMQKVLKRETKEARAEAVINIVIRADVLGSLEAIQESLERFDTQGIEVSVVSSGLGHITEADVLRAQDANALLLGFRAYPLREAEELARSKGVVVKSFDIIYDLLDFIAEHASGQVGPEVIRHELGELKVLKVFRSDKDSQVLGGAVTSGKIVAESKFDWLQNGTQRGQGELQELQSGKETVQEVVEGQQVGMKIGRVVGIEPGDILKFYQEEKKEKKVTT